MAIGGFLGGLANLGAVSRGYEAQSAQEQQLQLAALRQRIAQDALAEEQRQRQLQQQSASAAFGLLNDPNSPLAGLANVGGSQQPNYAPGAMQGYNLGPPGGPTAQPLSAAALLAATGVGPGTTYGGGTGAGIDARYGGGTGAGIDATYGGRNAPGMRSPYMPGVGGMRSGLPRITGPGGLIETTESGGRNINNARFDPAHTAGGVAQITDSTWNDFAPQMGLPRLQYPQSPKDVNVADQRRVEQAIYDQRGPAPWANYNPQLRQALSQLDGTQQQQAQDAAISTATAVPPAYTGRLNLPQLAQLIKRNNPGISDEAGMGALLMLNNLWSPQAKQQFEEFKFGVGQTEKRREFDIREKEVESQHEFNRLLAGQRLEGQGWIPLQTQGGGILRFNPRTGEVAEANLPPGTSKLGGPTSTSLPELKYPDKWEGMPNTPPPGVTESAWDIALNFARTGQMPALGFASDLRRPVIQAYPAALHALGIEPSKASDIAAAYAGERHAEIVGGGRAAQIALGLKEAEQLGPTVTEAAKGIPATNFPVYNQFLNWLNTQTGDPNIVKFRAALNSFLQTYTRTVGGSMQLTDFRLRHAYELINDAMAHGQINSAISQLTYEMQVMGSAVPGAMQDLQQIGQPPATREQQRQTPASPGSTQQYRSPGDVETAVKNGQLSREEGIAILQNQFGAK